jgi:uncharacterized radical SAM superfamily protein/biotin synthase-related radical SAM superfamily protein
LDDLDSLLQQAWQTRQACFPPILGADNPRRTRSVSLTGTACALECAHCGRHYLKAMLPVATLSPDDPRLKGVSSLLVSGGCDAHGRVPITAHRAQIHALRAGRRLNWHTGLVDKDEARALAGLADVVSFDLVGDDATIAEVYGLRASVEDYRAAYRLLLQHVPVVPHITIGLRGGKISGERTALDILRAEGATAIVFLVLIPTIGTRYADRTPPPVREVARLLAEARLAFPHTPLLLGCMRPGGAYRQALDPLAVRAGINRIVKPARTALALARQLGLAIEAGEECCALDVNLPHRSPSLCPSLRVSAGTEAVLGLRQRPMQAAPTTAYLMLDGGGCAMDCAFCAQARDSQARADALSRVVWPAYPTETVVEALRDVPVRTRPLPPPGPPDEGSTAPAAGERGLPREDASSLLRRVCFQVTVHRGALEEVQAAVRAVRQVTARPISVAIRPAGSGAIAALLDGGVDAIGLGLDCATEAVYRTIKGAGWRKMVALVEEACRRFPGHIRVHLMVGLGETEAELCRAIQAIYDWGGAVGLFAFTPVRGTPLAGRPQPSLDAYRRMQAARFLIDRRLVRVEDLSFAAGRLTSFGRPDWRTLLADGTAFRTSGCPGCNRPFYNERPGGILYNYPEPLSPEEAARALAALKKEVP